MLTDNSSIPNLIVQKTRRKRKKHDTGETKSDHAGLDLAEENGMPNSLSGCENRCSCTSRSVQVTEGKKRRGDGGNRIQKKRKAKGERGGTCSEMGQTMNTSGIKAALSSTNSSAPIVIGESNEVEDSFAPLHHLSGGKIKKSLKILRSKGIVPNTGPWTTDEVNKLHENMMQYLLAHTVKSFPRLIIPHTKEEKKFRRDTEFLFKMCKGIRRTQINVSNRIVSQYSNFLNKGSLSDKEKHELVTLGKNGKSWKDIGIIMNRSCHNLHYFYYVNSRSWNTGPWSGEEDELLRKAVENYKLARGDEDQGTWNQISEMVATRNPRTCLNRWKRNLSKRLDTIEDVVFKDGDAKRLVSMIFDSNFEDEYLVDWTQLSEKFDKTVTPAWLRWKWGVLTKEIPHSHFLEFPEIVEKVHELYISKDEK